MAVLSKSPPLPTVLESERILLGRLLRGSPSPHNIGAIHPSIFAEPGHGLIFSKIASLLNADMPVWPFPISSGFGRGEIDELGGPAYLAVLARAAQDAPTTYGTENYAAVVIDAWQKRCLISIGELLHDRGEEVVTAAYGLTSSSCGLQLSMALIQDLADVLSALRIIACLHPATNSPVAGGQP